MLRISAPPFDTQASASLQAASVDRSTSGPVAVHKSHRKVCSPPHVSALGYSGESHCSMEQVQVLTKILLFSSLGL